MNEEKLKEKVDTVRLSLLGKITNKEACKILKVSTRTFKRCKSLFILKGIDGLIDKRGGNNLKLTKKDREDIRHYKIRGPWRSARKVRDDLKLPVHPQTVWRILSLAGLMHANFERLKPLIRFVAKYPNDLWQSDIMGRIRFPHLGICYLIASLDDHSRFILSSNWFTRQNKQNVFYIWYAALRRWGIPKGMLQDRGTQYKANARFGKADYQYYASLLGIRLIWAYKAQTKGKIERFWRFVQRDFVRENFRVSSLQELNQKWNLWVAWYNYAWRGKALGLNGKTPAESYQESAKKVERADIDHLLVIEERRKVTRESTISLYGKIYPVPRGYIGCRIWAKIKGNKLFFEASGETLSKQRLKP
ncbi:MAG: DDE-type integrase/transposase/recombinase [bacterium]